MNQLSDAHQMAKANRKKKRKEVPFMVIAVDGLKDMMGSKFKGKHVQLTEEQVTSCYLMFKEALLY